LKEAAELLDHCEKMQKEGADLLELFETGKIDDEELKVGFLDK
jgi:hypothetical protein